MDPAGDGALTRILLEQGSSPLSGPHLLRMHHGLPRIPHNPLRLTTRKRPPTQHPMSMTAILVSNTKLERHTLSSPRTLKIIIKRLRMRKLLRRRIMPQHISGGLSKLHTLHSRKEAVLHLDLRLHGELSINGCSREPFHWRHSFYIPFVASHALSERMTLVMTISLPSSLARAGFSRETRVSNSRCWGVSRALPLLTSIAV